MKKIIYSIVILALSFQLKAQSLTSGNFTLNFSPQFMGSGTANRLPVVFRATISGLAPNTLYRYFTNLALATDFNTTSSGAGNALYPRTTTFGYTTSASLATLGGYDSLTTDGSGNHTGWFSVVNTGNSRFTAGNFVYPSVILDSSGSRRGVITSRFVATNDSIRVLGYVASAGATNGTGIQGTSFATEKNIVCLYDNTAGTGRPLSITYVENIGFLIPSIVPFYASSVQAVAGAWGTIIPNTLPNGIRRIEQRTLATGAIVNSNTSSNGTWGATNTVNPIGGTTSLVISSTNAPLPVKWSSFTASKNVDGTLLKWSTASENNNSYFEVQQSSDGRNYESLSRVKGSGTSTRVSNYSFLDNVRATSRTTYYRLKQVDFDGKSEYSRTISVANNETRIGITATLPNPFNSELVVNVNVAITSLASIQVMDMIGKVHSTINTQFVQGNNTVSFNTSDMSYGIYFVRVNANGETFTQKVIKK